MGITDVERNYVNVAIMLVEVVYISIIDVLEKNSEENDNFLVVLELILLEVVNLVRYDPVDL